MATYVAHRSSRRSLLTYPDLEEISDSLALPSWYVRRTDRPVVLLNRKLVGPKSHP